MRRIEMMELHDHPAFPGLLRDLVTDALEALWEFGNSYKPILPMLYEGIAGDARAADVAGTCVDSAPLEVVDLCSGGGGPWLRLAREFNRTYGKSLSVCLTDKYPNRQAFERARRSAAQEGAANHISYIYTPVDATRVSPELAGFRTIFSSFHHFGPQDARAMLRDAVEHRRGIGVFEAARRHPWTLLVLCVTPLLVLWLTLWMRPFRWTRLLWTFMLPVVPFTIWFDGMVSCLRAYSTEELHEMVAELVPVDREYLWKIGEARTGLLPVTYLVGKPVADRTAKGTEKMVKDARLAGIPPRPFRLSSRR